MRPENVKPEKFKAHTVIYNNRDFSIAYGIWENSSSRIAMRWNGDEDGLGYPSQGGNPLWFQLPNEGIWTNAILKAVDKIKAYEERIKDLNSKL